MDTYDKVLDVMDRDEIERDDYERGSDICPCCGVRGKSVIELCCDTCAQADAWI